MPVDTLERACYSVEELRAIASQANGANVLLNLVRQGAVEPADAVALIDQQRRGWTSRAKGYLMTLMRVFLPG